MHQHICAGKREVGGLWLYRIKSYSGFIFYKRNKIELRVKKDAQMCFEHWFKDALLGSLRVLPLSHVAVRGTAVNKMHTLIMIKRVLIGV